MGAHNLNMARGRYSGIPWLLRRCDRCSADHLRSLECKVDDEQHMLFECEAFAGERVDIEKELQSVDGRVKNLFAGGGSCDVLRFVSFCMKVVDKRAKPGSNG